MVLLHLRTDNTNNLVLAKFDSIYDDAYIQFSNINNSVYYAGLSKDSIKIYNPANSKDNGLLYNNNTLTVRNLNAQIIDNNNYSVFPNDFTTFDQYEFTEVDTNLAQPCYRCFDNDDTTAWISPNIYNPYTSEIRKDFEYRYNFQDSYGYWIKIKFPYNIIPIGFSVNSVTNIQDPVNFVVYVSANNTDWKKILIVNTLITSGEYYFINTDFYSYITIVVTKININPSQPTTYQSFKINSLKVFSRPIVHINSKIKICDNNIYNIKSLNTSNLLINNVSISSIDDLSSRLLSQAITTIKNDNTFYWFKNGSIGYFNTDSISKLALNKNTANAILDINGDITYTHRSITNRLIINNTTTTFQILSSYVYIGKVSFLNTAKQYFKIFIYLYEIDKFYFQTLTIHGYSFLSSSTGIFNSYWETEFDNTYVVQRINDIIYTIENEGTNKTIIKYYIKYNDVIDFTKSRSVSPSGRDFVNNVIYSDCINTSSSTEIQFIPSVSPEFFIDGYTFYNTILIKTVNFNKTGCFYKDFNASNLSIEMSVVGRNLIFKLVDSDNPDAEPTIIGTFNDEGLNSFKYEAYTDEVFAILSAATIIFARR